MSKESFKQFIKNKPYLAKAVFDGKTTFQKLYEAYDLYGEDSDVFNSYLNNNSNVVTTNNKTTSFNEVVNMFRNMDLDTIQKGVTSLQKAVNLIGEIMPKNSSDNIPNYDERPINRYYED